MRKKTVAVLLTVMALMMTGCGNTIPDLTDEQLQEVGEYTAMLLLSHDVNYKSRLVDVETLVTEEADESAEVEKPEETPAPENVGMDPTEDTPVVDMTDGSGSEEQSSISLEEALGLPEQLLLTFAGYDITDSYPKEASSEEYFTVDAGEGNKLLVLSFSLQNQGEGTETVDIIGQKPLIKVSVNGISVNSLATFLSNDLTLFQESLNPGESREVVVLAEYEAASLLDIAAVEINVKNGERNATILLE